MRWKTSQSFFIVLSLLYKSNAHWLTQQAHRRKPWCEKALSSTSVVLRHQETEAALSDGRDEAELRLLRAVGGAGESHLENRVFRSAVY